MKSQRRSSENRKTEIVIAALELSEHLPIQKITTREIAARVNISQPAVYRHFRSRDRIFEAVIEYVRQHLEENVTRMFESLPAGTTLKQKISLLLNHLSGFPGFPKFFFYYFSQGKPSKAQNQLGHLRSMVQSLIAQLIVDDADVIPTVDGVRAAGYLVALIQGQQLSDLFGNGQKPRQQISARDSFSQSLEEIITFWHAGLQAGFPEQKHEEAIQQEKDQSRRSFLGLDVRKDIQSGMDPFKRITATLQRLDDDGLLVIQAPFRPAPLVAYLSGQGYESECVETPEAWLCVIRSKGTEYRDFSLFEAPLPLEKTLEWCALLNHGQSGWIKLPKVPHLLIPRLEERALHFNIYEECEAVFLQIQKAPL